MANCGSDGTHADEDPSVRLCVFRLLDELQVSWHPRAFRLADDNDYLPHGYGKPFFREPLMNLIAILATSSFGSVHQRLKRMMHESGRALI